MRPQRLESASFGFKGFALSAEYHRLVSFNGRGQVTHPKFGWR
jgi:hypothetical protein